MAINDMFQILVSGVCTGSKGVFKRCTIKGFVRMFNKCISRDDHQKLFLFDDDRAEQQFFYRTVMINWLLFTPGLAHGELAEQAKPLWERYHGFQSVSGHGDMGPSGSWGTWRKQIEVASNFL